VKKRIRQRRSDNSDGISDDEDAPPPPSEDLQYRSAFEKAEQYDKHLDDPNPWHPDLRRPLFSSQVIGFRWMADRHSKGGIIVADKVGIGKVRSPSHVLWLIHRHMLKSIFCFGSRNSLSNDARRGRPRRRNRRRPEPRPRGNCVSWCWPVRH